MHTAAVLNIGQLQVLQVPSSSDLALPALSLVFIKICLWQCLQAAANVPASTWECVIS